MFINKLTNEVIQMNTINTCEYLYGALKVPIYLYKNEMTLTTCFPPQFTYTHPLPEHLAILINSHAFVSYLETDLYSYYGCISFKDKKEFIVVGPVNPYPYTDNALSVLQKNHKIDYNKSIEFDLFFKSIPTHNIDSFASILLLINYLINNTPLTRENVIELPMNNKHFSLDTIYFNNSEIYEYNKFIDFSYDLEKEGYCYIETGNMIKLEEFIENHANKHYDRNIITKDNIKHIRTAFIMSITLMSRSAIKGGLLPNTAFQLSDTYFLQMEALNSIEQIEMLLLHAAYDFTKRTLDSNIPSHSNKLLYYVTKYIKENIYKNITVTDISNYLHFNRSYLSHKFKIESGIALSNYILSCKLEEGKNLLEFTSKSISEISNLLCFSNQSHFQNSFKKKFNITPHKFRISK